MKIISGNYKRLNKIFNDIDFKTNFKNGECWIKIVQTKNRSYPSSLHIILNNEQYDFNIYDKNGSASDKVYFRGSDITPSFYLKTLNKRFKVDFKANKIEIKPINEDHVMESYLKNFCSFISPNSSIWAVSKLFTSRPEKPPFNEM